VDANLRVVTQLPLRELWRDDGFSTTARGKSITHDDIREFLTSGPVQFVVVDVGRAPRWIPASECFDFWKNEAGPHLASGKKASLNEFPGGYCYFASQWQGETTTPILLLEKHH
jgi:hypothetical protein